MKDFRLRAMTGALAGTLFLGTYLIAPPFFLGLLGAITFWVLVIEWPQVIGYRLIDPRFWGVSLIYPLMPMITLMYLVVHFRHDWPIVPLYPFIASWIVDASAYVVGSRWGRHLCVPSISPNKTWEGMLAGVLSLLLINIACVLYYNLQVSTLFVVAASIVVAVIAIFGDLFMSWLKRRRGIKDTGRVLPGHGGLLDRFDSVLFIAAVMSLYIGYLYATV